MFLTAAGALALAACTLEALPDTGSSEIPGVDCGSGVTVAFTAYAEGAGSKASLGVNDGGRPQSFWENGDAISVYTSADGTSGTVTGYRFSTALDAPASSATFVFDGEGSIGSGDYLATYPYRADPRGVNYTREGDVYKVAAVDIPRSQALVAGTFDRKSSPAIAYAAEGSNAMSFRNASALLKFRVTESDIIGGRIEVDPGDAISGRFRADIDVTTLLPELKTYNQPYYSYVDFSIDGSTPLDTGTDYYVAVRPVLLTSDLRIYLNGNLVKTINASQLARLERNRIYNLGTLATPAEPAEKLLVFNFATAPAAGWPTAKHDHHDGGDQVDFSLYGTPYTFILADCYGATACQTYWATSPRCLTLAAELRYLGLPAIDGYKLVQVSCDNVGWSSVVPNIAITDRLAASVAEARAITDSSPDIVAGGEFQTWDPDGGGTYTYILSGTRPNTVYYVYALKKGGIGSLRLTYVPSRADDEVVRVGTYNVRYITEESDSNNNWENRKTRVVRSIRDNGFDVFGLNECSVGIQSYLTSQLADTYTIRYFSPYSSTGAGSGGEAIGLAYRTSMFTLSNWNFFWLSDNPSVMTTNDGTHKRGGCCAVLTNKATGTKIFAMVTHGALDADARARYASQYRQMEAQYNPNSYPSIFVGDMNAQPDDPASLEYRQYWSDVYFSSASKSGPYCTFSNFNLERNMYTYKKRLDYIYYRNAVPLRYICNDTRYDGYYASDHLPVCADMIVN